jgi:integrase
MKKCCPENERIKRRYFTYIKEAKRQSESTVDVTAKALARFEEYTKWRDFKTFNSQQAIGFKNHLAEQTGERSGEKLSKATLHATLTNLKRFFQWLADKPGYRSRFHYSDAEYFNLSQKDVRIATAKREKPVPTLEQIKHVISMMPANTDIEKRNRALLAFALLTGARADAMASARIKHIDLAAGSFYQDARDVRTKFSKTFTTYFFPIGDDILGIVAEWVTYLREEKLWGYDDPVFPSTHLEYCQESRQFAAAGISRNAWKTTSSIRDIFREAFEAAGLPYFNPHSIRDTLVHFGESVCCTIEDFKAWSQNIGHEKVLTTLHCYGEVPQRRQGEIFRRLRAAG